MSALIDWLIALEAKDAESSEFACRLLEYAISLQQTKRLGECLASLVVRSPAMRERIRGGVEYGRKRFGIADCEADKSLVVRHHCL